MGANDFEISRAGIISENFLNSGIGRFADACAYIRELPYGRNADKGNLPAVFKEKRGTCGTKHAVLRQLAVENGEEKIKMKMGLIKMSARLVPAIDPLLKENGMTYFPEAHNYLSNSGCRLDFTGNNFSVLDFEDDIISETDMEPDQIGDYKVAIHKQSLRKWLMENPGLKMSLEELWTLREKCIALMSAN